jgi:hypothetical protein
MPIVCCFSFIFSRSNLTDTQLFLKSRSSAQFFSDPRSLTFISASSPVFLFLFLFLFYLVFTFSLLCFFRQYWFSLALQFPIGRGFKKRFSLIHIRWRWKSRRLCFSSYFSSSFHLSPISHLYSVDFNTQAVWITVFYALQMFLLEQRVKERKETKKNS